MQRAEALAVDGVRRISCRPVWPATFKGAIRLLRTKLIAFAVSSFYCGVAGALWGFMHLGAWEPLTFEMRLEAAKVNAEAILRAVAERGGE